MRQGLSLKPIAVTSDRLRKEQLGQTAAPIASPYSKGPGAPSASPAPQGPGPSMGPPGAGQAPQARPGGLQLARPPAGGTVPTSPNRPPPAPMGAARGLTPAGPGPQRPALPGAYQAAATNQDRAGMAPWQVQGGGGVSSAYGTQGGGRYTGEGLWGYSGQGEQPWRNTNDLGVPSNPEVGSYRAAAEKAAADYGRMSGGTPTVDIQRADGGYSQAGPRQAGGPVQAGGQGAPGEQTSQSSTAGGRGYSDEELKGRGSEKDGSETLPDEWVRSPQEGVRGYGVDPETGVVLTFDDAAGVWRSTGLSESAYLEGQRGGNIDQIPLSSEQRGFADSLVTQGYRVGSDGEIFSPDGEQVGSIYDDPSSLGGKVRGLYDEFSRQSGGEDSDPLADVKALLEGAGTLEGIDQSKVDAMVNAARRKQAMESSQAMIMASEAGSRSRLGPEATAGIGAEISQRGGIEQANTEAKIRLESEIQNMQARMVDYQGRLQNLRMLAAMSQDAQTRQAAIDGQKEMMRYAAELQAEIDGAQSQLSSAFGMAGSGAMAGAGFGSMFGPAGAGVGAGVGGFTGFLSGLLS